MSSSAAAPAGPDGTALLSTSATGLSTLTRSSGLEATPASTKGRGSLLRWLRRSGRRFAPSHRVDARIVGINVLVGYVVRVHVIPVDVVRVHVVPIDVVHIHVIHVHIIPVDVVHVYVVVIDVSVDVVVVIDVVVVHIATHYCGVDVNSAVAVIYVHAVDVNVMGAGRYPP